MDYTKFIKKMDLPAGYLAPERLAYGSLVAQALGRQYPDDDSKRRRGIRAYT